MGLKCVFHLGVDFFSILLQYHTVLDWSNTWIWKASCQVIGGFSTAWRISAPNLCIVQRSNVHNIKDIYVGTSLVVQWLRNHLPMQGHN